MKKAAFFWILSIVLVVVAVFGLLWSGGPGGLGILFLVLLFLALFGGGTTSIITTVRAAGSGDSSEKWLEDHQWNNTIPLKYDNWSLYFNNQTREVAVFDRRASKKEPDRILAFKDIADSELSQETVKGKTSIQLVIEFVSGQPYAMVVTGKPLPPDSPELQGALAFAKKVNELLSMMAFENAAGTETGKRYVIAKCYNCGQLLHGEAGKTGWCPKCKADIQMPAI